jgi:hypothetical protein
MAPQAMIAAPTHAQSSDSSEAPVSDVSWPLVMAAKVAELGHDDRDDEGGQDEAIAQHP